MTMPPPTLSFHFSIISFFFFFFFLLSFFNPSLQSQISISLNTTVLSKSGDSLLIQWSGIDSPSELDWLGIYSPPDFPHDNFIGYVFLSKSPSWQSGSGSISLPLVNLRSDYSFRIFRWTRSEIDMSRQDQDHNPLPGTAHLLASSEAVSFQSGRGPEQIHLAFTDNDDEMRVVYITENPRETYVRYGEGEGEGKLDGVAVARVRRYEREHMCDAPANESVGWRDPGYIHDGVMTNLKKGVRYYYKVLS